MNILVEISVGGNKMKKFVFAVSLMLILVLSMLSPLAQAQNVPAGPALTVSELQLGDDRQERSNPRHDDDDDVEVNVTETITVTNSGDRRLSNLRSTVSPGADAGGQKISLSDLLTKVSIPSDGSVLDVGESIEVTVEMRVPEQLDAVDKKGRKTGFNVADITFHATHSGGTFSKTVNVEMEAENKLIIDDAKISFNGETETIDEDDKVEDVRPGDEILMEFQIENRYNDDEDVDIEDIEIIVEGGRDIDVEEEESIDDLNPEDTDSVEIDFQIDEDANRGNEDLEITLLGEDENGARHGEMWEITLEIEKPDHEIGINSVILNPVTVSCERSTDITVEIRNTGRRDEDETYIKIINSELDYERTSERLDLDDGDEVTRTYTIPVPEETLPGQYRISVETYYDTIRRSVTDTTLLVKEACERKPASEPEKDGGEIVVVTQPPAPEPERPEVNRDTTPPADDAADETEKGFMESNVFIVLLIVGYLAVLCGGAIFAFRLLKK